MLFVISVMILLPDFTILSQHIIFGMDNIRYYDFGRWINQSCNVVRPDFEDEFRGLFF